MEQEQVCHAVRPVKEFFNASGVGYVMVIYPSNVDSSAVQKKFTEQNGVIVPFYADRAKYLVDVLTVKIKHGL